MHDPVHQQGDNNYASFWLHKSQSVLP